MADRNLTSFRQYSFYTTREGMGIYVPPSDKFEIEHLPRVVDPFIETSVQLFPLGTRLEYAERVFRYCKNGASQLAVAKLNQMPVPVAGWIDEALNTPAVGDTTITLTPTNCDDVSADDWADSYLWINDDTGEGYMYRVKSNTAACSGSAVTVTLYDPILVAPGACATGTVVVSPWSGAIVHPSPPTARLMGVNVIVVTANYYHWQQVKGPCTLLVDGTVVINEDVVASDAVNGAVEPADSAITDGTPPTGHGERKVGHVIAVNATTEYAGVWLELE